MNHAWNEQNVHVHILIKHGQPQSTLKKSYSNILNIHKIDICFEGFNVILKKKSVQTVRFAVKALWFKKINQTSLL